MSDTQDVKQRVNEAWRTAAMRAYEAANGVVDDEPVREARPWRWAMSPRVALTLVGALALIGAVVTWWPAPPRGEPVPFPTATTSGLIPDAAHGAVSDRAHGAERTSVITVHVAGRVHAPGLYELDEGARVADAIDSAGGAVDPRDLDALNLARPVRDGERVAVGLEEATGRGPVNLNSASEDELVELPGVGPVLAARIVAHREANGPFGSVDELDAVPGVGPAVLAGLRDDATV